MEYSYDPWGNIEYHFVNEELENDEEVAMMFTALCPLTYRGYNYDFTTGLYYLQSRYYNPEWGRFINCDDTNILLATQGETHNANLFAYCSNNPINKIDPSGYDPNEIAINVVYGLIAVLALERVHESYKDIRDIYVKSPVTEGGGNLKDPFDREPYKTVWKFMPDSISCKYEIRNNVIYLQVKLHILFSPGIEYCEYDIEIRDNKTWDYIMQGGDLRKIYDDTSERYAFLLMGAGSVEMGNFGTFVSIVTEAPKLPFYLYRNSPRAKYYYYMKSKQNDLYKDNTTFLLNSYCTYKIGKVGAKYRTMNYQEHDCVKEYKAWAKK